MNAHHHKVLIQRGMSIDTTEEFERDQIYAGKLQRLVDNLSLVPTSSLFPKRKAPRVQQRPTTAKPQETGHISGASTADTIRSMLGDETRREFKCPRIPTLRQSPARIVWPRRPEPGPEETTSETNNSEQLDETEAIPRRPTTNASFWDHARGNMRIDSQYYGAPRFDPYHSVWSPDERRCFFTSGFKPYHKRGYNPVKVVQAHARQWESTQQPPDGKKTRKLKALLPVDSDRL